MIHHSDQGSQYTSGAFGERCRKMGVRPSMGSVGDAYDKAMAESFFATLECELIDRTQLADEDRSAAGAVHQHRRLVQPAAATQRDRPDLAGRIRNKDIGGPTSTIEHGTRVTHSRRLRGRSHAAGG